jgi:hypothetical protein
MASVILSIPASWTQFVVAAPGLDCASAISHARTGLGSWLGRVKGDVRDVSELAVSLQICSATRIRVLPYLMQVGYK